MGALITAAAAGLVIGFLAGLVTFKRSLRWCSGCGAVLRCPECPGRGTGRSAPPAASVRTR